MDITATDFATQQGRGDPASEPIQRPRRISRRQTMRAAVFAGPGEIRIEETELPQPGPHQVRIHLEGCGVCSSNIPVWEGRPWFEYPHQPGNPGHEGWGIVDAVGAEVTCVKEGDRVAALSYHAYAEYDVADATAVVKLPSNLEGAPFPGEPLGCAMNVFRRSDIHHGQTVAVIGVGFLGAIVIRLAKNAGARVIAISRRPFSLDVARQFGADDVIPLDSREAVVSQVNALAEEGCERVIEATGCQGPLDIATDIVRIRGKLIIAGYHQDGQRQVNMQLWNWRGIDVINAHERDQRIYLNGIRRAIEEMDSGRLEPTPLYTHTFLLDELAVALEHTRLRPEGFMKALVLMGQ